MDIKFINGIKCYNCGKGPETTCDPAHEFSVPSNPTDPDSKPLEIVLLQHPSAGVTFLQHDELSFDNYYFPGCISSSYFSGGFEDFVDRNKNHIEDKTLKSVQPRGVYALDVMAHCSNCQTFMSGYLLADSNFAHDGFIPFTEAWLEGELHGTMPYTELSDTKNFYDVSVSERDSETIFLKISYSPKVVAHYNSLNTRRINRVSFLSAPLDLLRKEFLSLGNPQKKLELLDAHLEKCLSEIPGNQLIPITFVDSVPFSYEFYAQLIFETRMLDLSKKYLHSKESYIFSLALLMHEQHKVFVENVLSGCGLIDRYPRALEDFYMRNEGNGLWKYMGFACDESVNSFLNAVDPDFLERDSVPAVRRSRYPSEELDSYFMGFGCKEARPQAFPRQRFEISQP